MLQTIIVILIVVTAVVFAVRGLVRTIKGKRSCNCNCDNCPNKSCNK
ncbi:MAG: FeoB-associated Cys-rich membrane protein [Bacteroidales bacterium]|nr:FeoB-associated Cys-rich membrane protein [Bacteroidales bacterium]